jgi:hypothetical protein
MTTRSAPTAMKLAAEAAIPSTTAVTEAGCRRSALRIATPSYTSPPGELTCRVISETPDSSARAALNSRAETPQSPPHESITSYR